jgi:hypothetical protein
MASEQIITSLVKGIVSLLHTARNNFPDEANEIMNIALTKMSDTRSLQCWEGVALLVSTLNSALYCIIF